MNFWALYFTCLGLWFVVGFLLHRTLSLSRRVAALEMHVYVFPTQNQYFKIGEDADRHSLTGYQP